MSIGNFDQGRGQPMAEINMTPLVDVMLVLLIIFIVTAPLMTQSLPVNLPNAKAAPAEIKPETIRIAIDATGQIYWNDAHIEESKLVTQFGEAAKQRPAVDVQLSADKETRYQKIAEIMSLAREAGIEKLGFVTLPPRR